MFVYFYHKVNNNNEVNSKANAYATANANFNVIGNMAIGTINSCRIIEKNSNVHHSLFYSTLSFRMVTSLFDTATVRSIFNGEKYII